MYYLFYLIPGILVYETYYYLNRSLEPNQNYFLRVIEYVFYSFIVVFITATYFILDIKIRGQKIPISRVDIVNLYDENLANVILVVLISVIIVLTGKYVIDFFRTSEEYRVGKNIFTKDIVAYLKHEKMITKYVKIRRRDKDVVSGMPNNYYELPWEYKEIMLQNNPDYTYPAKDLRFSYYDVEADLVFDIYYEKKGEIKDVK